MYVNDKNPIRIGTRDSELALWQANQVAQMLAERNIRTEIISVKSEGDLVLDKPLYEMGITGIFTKTLDIALIRGEIDIAVHSFKDVPTKLPYQIDLVAVLPRANTADLLVYKNDLEFLSLPEAIIATGSLRRKAQWLHKYPSHTLVNLRGNVNTRLQKLEENAWNAAIFALAGLERIQKVPKNSLELDFMLPAPAQGAMAVVCRKEDLITKALVSPLHNEEAGLETQIERNFLNKLEGGCSAPIGARACVRGKEVFFACNLLSLDGKKKVAYETTQPLECLDKLFTEPVAYVLENGGREIIASIPKRDFGSV